MERSQKENNNNHINENSYFINKTFFSSFQCEITWAVDSVSIKVLNKRINFQHQKYLLKTLPGQVSLRLGLQE